MISFKGAHYPKDVILYAVFFYVRYGVSYRDLEEILEERRVIVDHATLNRWVIKYSTSLALAAKKSKRSVATSWRMDETYIKVKGQWVYLYRAIDKFGDTVDFMLSEKRDEAAATAFFRQAIDENGFPLSFIEILQIKYLNNRIEQDHRFIKKITKPMGGFKAFHSAKATIDGIETAHMIRKGQLADRTIPAYQQFMALAG